MVVFVQGQVESCEGLVSSIQIEADSTPAYDFSADRHRKIGRIKDSNSRLEIRYYLTPSITTGSSVIIVKCVDGRFEARKIVYSINYKKPIERRKARSVIVTRLEPTTSWDSFINDLKDMTFFTFPTMDDVRPRMKKYMVLDDGRTVEKRVSIVDGAHYSYQVKIGNSIRSFSYHSPMAWFKVYDNVQELKIAEDIKNHFVNNLEKKKKE